MDKKVLMIAFHFPPLKGSSGIQRTLKFCQYLPNRGWNPIVLSANERAYEAVSQEQIKDIPPNIVVKRAFALDTKKHLSIKGRYPIYLVLPDRWFTWFFGGVIQGYILAHRHKPSILWSTYPIATAHLIGYALHRITGIPWVADLRDPMAQDGYPENQLQWKFFKWIEDRIAKYASAVCFTSPNALEEFMTKHSIVLDKSKLHLIENGYDEESFQEALQYLKLNPPNLNKPTTLLHSGIIYPSERDPEPFFKAVSTLKKNGKLNSNIINIILRATNHDDMLNGLISSYDIKDIVILAPPLPYIEALAEMLCADGLILFQAANCNYQIPAKLYEYLRTGCPILGLTDEEGDTALILKRFPINMICNIASSEQIESTLFKFIRQLKVFSPIADMAFELSQYSRQQKTYALANLFDRVIK